MLSRILILALLACGSGVALAADDPPGETPHEPKAGTAAAAPGHEAKPGDTHTAPAGGGGHEEGGVPSPLSFDPDLSIFTAIVFVILLLILGKFAWGPIMEGLEKREQAIAQNIADAERTNREARELLVNYEKRIAEANAEVRELLDKGRREAEAQGQKIVHAAEEVAAAEKNRAVAAIGAAKEAALRELAERSVETAIGLAKRVLRSEISPQKHQELIGETLAQFPNRN